MYAATGGGGGGDTVVDYGAMTEAAASLDAAGGRLDGSGSGAPGVGNVGDAAPLAAAILAAFAEAGAHVSAEATTMAGIVEACSTGMQATDAQQAVTMLTTGAG